MKWLLLCVVLAASGTVLAKYGGGTPSVPCYIDGEYQGNMLITKCRQQGGKVAGEKGFDKKEKEHKQ